MPDDTKEKLTKLGSDTLLDTTKQLDYSDDRTNRIESTQKEKIREFKKNLTSIIQSGRSKDSKNSSTVARMLLQILEDLKTSTPDPCLGVELMTQFYETADSVVLASDDSHGTLKNMYTLSAKDLFVEYAKSCMEKEKISSLLMHLCQDTPSAVLPSLMDTTSAFLDEKMIRTLMEKMQDLSVNEQDANKKNFFQNRVLSCARQIKDVRVFEKTLLAIQGEIPESIIEIARFYLSCDDVDSAFAWIQKFPNDTIYLRKRYISILTDIYARQGDTENLIVMLKKRFRKLHMQSVLQEILDVIGEDSKETVIAEEIPYILNDTMLTLSNLEFLLEVGRLKDAETYLFSRTDEIAGIWHEEILPIANTFEEQKSFLATSLIYRGLLDFILENADTPFYPYAVNFLKKLDIVAPSVSDWQSFPDHTAYKESLVKEHGRKRSFWGQYAKYRST